MQSLRRLLLPAVALMLNPGWAPGPAIAGEAPGLTVILVVDQLTAERTREWAEKPSSSGFRRLWQGNDRVLEVHGAGLVADAAFKRAFGKQRRNRQ